jgi:VIT1/CCC1 family predicted Fe2+/Mn2+ transporter
MNLKIPIRIGLGFGITSAVITTLGIMIGLSAGTSSKLAVIGGILTISIADAFSDALGIHISEESELKNTEKHIWIATTSTFLTKLLFGLTFLIPILLVKLSTAIYINIGWGLFLLIFYSSYLARKQNRNSLKIIGEHVAIALIVIVITHFFGLWIAAIFG